MSKHVLNVQAVRCIVRDWLANNRLENAVEMGLPEFEPRHSAWRVALLCMNKDVGQAVVKEDGCIVDEQTTTERMIVDRILGRRSFDTSEVSNPPPKRKNSASPKLSDLKNSIFCGDNLEVLDGLPDESVNLVVTSPPYYNARLEYSDYVDYHDYLEHLRQVIRACHRVLSEGRFFAINISPVLLKRTSRKAQSKRLNIPFDVHPIFVDEGFDFIEDILWVKSSGAGWSSMRGGGFARTRTPLRYKTNPITEYILVYRKHTDKLIDWNIRNHPDPQDVEASKVTGDYEATNVWHITPRSHKIHSAVFPIELPRRIIQFYSFQNDVVLDPYAGIGTTAQACVELNRRYVMIERDATYVAEMQKTLPTPHQE